MGQVVGVRGGDRECMAPRATVVAVAVDIHAAVAATADSEEVHADLRLATAEAEDRRARFRDRCWNADHDLVVDHCSDEEEVEEARCPPDPIVVGNGATEELQARAHTEPV